MLVEASINSGFTFAAKGRSLPIAMGNAEDEFTRFEHEGWERVADKYDFVWSSLTRQFIPYVIEAAQVSPGMSVLDVAFLRKNGGNRKENVSRYSIRARRCANFIL